MLRRRRNGYDRIEERFDALKADFEAFQRDLRGLADGVQDVASEKFTEIKRNGEELGEWTSENVGTVRGVIRDQPLAACALSVGAGALVGALLLRR